MSKECFHCGLPTTEAPALSLSILGELHPFCCQGCLTVCRAIIDAGHEDYYRYRERPARLVDAVRIPSFLQQAELYDNPDIQRSFIRSGAYWREASMILEDIRCAACLWLNERHLRTLEGVLDVHVDYTSQCARVRWNPDRIKFSEILSAVAKIGYIAYPYDPAHREALAADQKRRSIERIIFACIIGMVIMNFSLASYFFGHPDAAGQYPLWIVIGRWTSLFAATAILAYPGQEFFLGAWRDLKRGRLGMDVPIVIGLLTAWGGSLIATLTQQGEVYYDSISMFVVLVSLARFNELRARRIAANSLDRMAIVIPASTRRLCSTGAEEKVPVIELAPGDRVRIRPGETVPVDGVIVEGLGSFDESLLTGEAVPVTKGVDERVVSGSINCDQPVIIQVTARSSESTVSEISRLVERGMKSRPYYVELAERAAAWFVGAILVIAAVTAVTWMWLDPSVVIQNLVAVLIVTCPCALALATPVAMTLSAARFIDLGIVPLRIKALAPLATSTMVVFDKTGTLTQGHPQVAHIECLGSLSEVQARHIAASLEQSSEHPVGKAMRLACNAEPLAVTHVRIHPGAGLEGTIDNVNWRLGKPEFAFKALPKDSEIPHRIQFLRGKGYTVILLANGQGPQALFGLKDPLRAGLDKMLAAWKNEGNKAITILSGDHLDTVSKLAAEVGIDQFYGGFSALDKLAWIRQAQAQGHRVLMIGDGVNDAPTLAAADTSLSFSEAANIAQLSSDFVIINSTLEHLSEARRLARKTQRIILQNLLWAAAYNVLAIPLAACGFIPPWGAAIGMSLSSLLVVGNSLRLRRTSREIIAVGSLHADLDPLH